MGVFNLDLGPTNPVADATAWAKDSVRGLQIGLASLGVGLAVGMAAFLLA